MILLFIEDKSKHDVLHFIVDKMKLDMILLFTEYKSRHGILIYRR